MLRALEVDAVALREELAENIKDPDLLAQMQGSDRVYITADTSQTTRLAEARALKEAGITALFFGPFWSKQKRWPQAVWLLKHWPLIDGFAAGVQKGTCAEIKQNGRA